MQKKIYNKVLKITMVIVILFSFIVIYPVKKADAIVPVLVPILTSVVMDTAVDAGINFVDKQVAKQKSSNIATKLWNKYGADLKKYKPTKKNAGKWALKLPAFLMAEIIDELGDLAETTKSNDPNPTGALIKGPKVYSWGTFSVEIVDEDDDEAYLFWSNYGGTFKYTPVDAKNAYLDFCIQSECFQRPVNPDTQLKLNISGPVRPNGVYHSYQIFKDGKSVGSYNGVKYNGVGGKYYDDWQNKKNGNGGPKTRFDFDGVSVHIDNDTYIRLDDGDKELTPVQMQKIDWSKLPGKYQDTDFDFDFDFSKHTDIKDGDEFEWEIVENDIQNKVDNDTIYNEYNFNYEPSTNNEYKLSDQQKNDLEQSINIVVNIVDDDDDGDSGSGGGGGMVCTEKGQIIPCKKVEKIDGSLLAYIKNAYEYATDTVDTAVDGLKSLGNSAKKIVEVYKVFFGWLPMEFQTLMYSSLAIMVGLRLFRK